MYAQIDSSAPSSRPAAARLTARRATLRNRPLIQRALVRSWEYIRPVRVALLAFRLLIALWLVALGALLMSAGYTWGWTLLPAAVGVTALSAWVFATAAKGWPVDEA